jgi:hypothetical protein
MVREASLKKIHKLRLEGLERATQGWDERLEGQYGQK